MPRSLRFLSGAIDRGAADDMQGLFPEGYLFTVVLTGLAQAELGLQAPEGSAERVAAAAEARRWLTLAESEAGQAAFSRSLDPPRGVFYVGWVAYLRAKILALEPESPDLSAALQRDGDALAAALGRHPSPYLPSYHGMAWPTDTVVAIAALSLHDQLRPPRYAAAIRAWLQAIRPTLDPTTGLFPHQVDPMSGASIDGPRGTSSAIITAFLPDIDEALAHDQYGLFRETFVVTRLGLPGIRERADDADPWRPLIEEGDVDSGPLVTGLSLSASAVAMASAARNQDPELAEGMRRAAELAGFPLGIREKRYLGGALPVADAFLAWARATPLPERAAWPSRLVAGGRLPALVFTLVGLALLLGPVSRGAPAPRRL